MFGIFLAALIIYAVVQHRKRKRLRWMRYGGGDWSKYDSSKHHWSKWAADAKSSTTASAERFARGVFSKLPRAFDTKMARNFEAKAGRFERKLRAQTERQTQKKPGVSMNPAGDLPPPPQFKNDAERQTY